MLPLTNSIYNGIFCKRLHETGVGVAFVIEQLERKIWPHLSQN
jgi:hypothetical protein